MYICPKCSLSLQRNQNTFACPQNHSYDVAKSGYVNLLLGAKAGVHGDDKEMIDARRAFLSLGHYSAIADTVFEILNKHSRAKEIKILDAGCGEGYYTNKIYKNLKNNGFSIDFYGIDVSKDAVLSASKQYKDLNLSVGSVNALPFKDEGLDAVISLFAPLCENEFARVLKPGGILITVSPSENHLYGLKEKIYEKPYKNPPSTFVPTILQKISSQTKEWDMTLSTQEGVTNLFKMTPYYHKSSKTDVEKALSLTSVSTAIGFEFIVYQKQPVSQYST